MNMNARHNMDRLFHVLAQELGKLSDEELEQVLAGNGRLQFVGVQQSRPKRGRVSTPDGEGGAGDAALDDLKTRLQASASRDEAAHLLENPPTRLKKADLVQLARLLNVRVTSRDTVEAIKEKIIKKVVAGPQNLFAGVELK
ncbi:MAG: hypothetical protein HC884_10460 [Chloroflexaceae bacterium]|nr:hypothetical protein [Chloroflexaceae bacterium]